MAHKFSLTLMLLILVIVVGGVAASAQEGSAPGWQARVDRAADVWQRQVIDPYGTSPYTSLALDAAGQPHVAYRGHDGAYRYSLKYAVFDGSAWQIMSVDNEMATGWYPALALDSRDEPHVAYHHAHDRLMYAHYYSGSWHNQTVDSGGDVGEHAALAVDSADRPHIAYADEIANSVKYAKRTGATWQVMTVAAMPAMEQPITLDLALDAADRPHICYYDDTVDQVKHAWYDGATWRLATVASNVTSYNGQGCSIAVDSDNHPHIVYSVLGLFYARHDGAQWQLVEVDHDMLAGREPSLALDLRNRPRIAYDVLDYPNYELRYAAFDGFDWQIEAAHSTTQGGAYPYGISLALADDGSPHVSYFMDVNGPPLHTWKTIPLERWTFLPAVQRR